MLNNLDDHRPRIGWSRPRIVDNSEKLYLIPICKKKVNIEEKTILFTGVILALWLLPMERLG
jgi:hypothetical protein